MPLTTAGTAPVQSTADFSARILCPQIEMQRLKLMSVRNQFAHR